MPRWLLLSLVLASTTGLRAQSLERAGELYASGRIAEAAREFRAFAESSVTVDPAAAAAGFNNACVLATQLGELDVAAGDCRRALDLRRREADRPGLSRTLNNLGLVEQRRGELDAAAAHYREALALNRQLDESEAETVNLLNLGVVSSLRGRYGDALRLYREAERLAAAHRQEVWAAEQSALARLNIATALEKIGAHDQALDVYLELLAEPALDDAGRRAELELNLGTAYRNLGDAPEALRRFSAAADHFRAIGDLAALGNALLNRALTLHLNLSELDAAEAAYRDALELARRSGDRSEEVQGLFYLGQLLIDRGRLAEAADVLEQGLTLAREIDSAEGRWSCLAGLAAVARRNGDADLAERRLREAMTEIERARGALLLDQRGHFFGDRRPIFDALVTLLVDRGRPADAFDVVQRAKARDLLDRLDGARAEPTRVELLLPRLRHVVLLEYWIAGERLLGFRLDSRGVEVIELGPSAGILDRVRRLHRSLATGEALEEVAAEQLDELARLVLHPLLANRSLPESRLWIAPDGLLRYLPFELLSVATGGPSLLEVAAVSYLPSASAWQRQGSEESHEQPPRLRFLGVAEIDPSHAPGQNLPPLPAGVEEVAAAADRLGSPAERLLAEAATESALRRRLEEGGARVVHLATHAVLDERDDSAVLLLAPGDGDDGLLRPSEVSSWSLAGELVVLAACDTALGGSNDGRALDSLTGAFVAAGAGGVVATLWPVADTDARVVTDLFYRQLARGAAPAEALRATKERLRDDPRWAAPSRWAGWVLIGDPPALPRRGPRAASVLLVVVGVALALAGLLLRRITARR